MPITARMAPGDQSSIKDADSNHQISTKCDEAAVEAMGVGRFPTKMRTRPFMSRRKCAARLSTKTLKISPTASSWAW
jgi:hypothetical protein